MANPYVGEIRMFGGNFAPAGWAFCSGQLLAISENDTLFNLIGTTYGGDGQETFALPNLQGRVPIHAGTGPGLSPRVIGEVAGTESVTLTSNQIPAHSHTLNTTAAAGTSGTPGTDVILADHGPAGQTAGSIYVPFTGTNQVQLASGSVQPAGGAQPHDNMQPYAVVSYIISLFGIYPSQ